MIASIRKRCVGRFRTSRPYADIDPDAESNEASVLSFKIMQQLRSDRAHRLLARAGVAWVTSDAPDPHVAGVLTFDVPGEPPHHLIPVANVRPYVDARTRVLARDLHRTPIRELAHALTDAATSTVAIVLDEEFSGSALVDAPSGRSGRAVLTERSPDRRVFEVSYEGEGASLVVIAELLHPGWHATVDGVSARIWQVDVGFMGVEVAPGSHRIRFEYDAIAPRWALISLGSLVLAIIAILAGLRRAASS
jgi:hypothetical protein